MKSVGVTDVGGVGLVEVEILGVWIGVVTVVVVWFLVLTVVEGRGGAILEEEDVVDEDEVGLRVMVDEDEVGLRVTVDVAVVSLFPRALIGDEYRLRVMVDEVVSLFGRAL